MLCFRCGCEVKEKRCANCNFSIIDSERILFLNEIDGSTVERECSNKAQKSRYIRLHSTGESFLMPEKQNDNISESCQHVESHHINGGKKMKCVSFGVYPQKSDGKLQPIEWIVLDTNQNKKLLLSQVCLEVKEYDKNHQNIRWSECSLRKWLNSEFLRSAFSEDEKKRIVESHIDNGRSNIYTSSSGVGGDPTIDKVFILCSNDVERYLTCDTRIAAGSLYAKKYTNNDDILGWWLRDSSYYKQPCVTASGEIFDYSKAHSPKGVRPAIWVDFSPSIEPIKHDFSKVQNENDDDYFNTVREFHRKIW